MTMSYVHMNSQIFQGLVILKNEIIKMLDLWKFTCLKNLYVYGNDCYVVVKGIAD